MTNGVVYCNRCGAQNSAMARFCANCGSPFTTEGSPVPPHSAPSSQPSEIAQPPQLPPAGVVPPPSPPTWQQPVAAAPAFPAMGYAGFWLRFVAAIIDGILVGIVAWPLSAMMSLTIGFAGSAVSMPEIGVHLVRFIVMWAFFLFAGWIYEASMESSSKQATLGKMALGLKVTDEAGRRISFARASGRFFSKLVSRVILYVGYIMAGFTARKQALHDMIAGTLVVRTQAL